MPNERADVVSLSDPILVDLWVPLHATGGVIADFTREVTLPA